MRQPANQHTQPKPNRVHKTARVFTRHSVMVVAVSDGGSRGTPRGGGRFKLFVLLGRRVFAMLAIDAAITTHARGRSENEGSFTVGFCVDRPQQTLFFFFFPRFVLPLLICHSLTTVMSAAGASSAQEPPTQPDVTGLTAQLAHMGFDLPELQLSM